MLSDLWIYGVCLFWSFGWRLVFLTSLPTSDAKKLSFWQSYNGSLASYILFLPFVQSAFFTAITNHPVLDLLAIPAWAWACLSFTALSLVYGKAFSTDNNTNVLLLSGVKIMLKQAAWSVPIFIGSFIELIAIVGF